MVEEPASNPFVEDPTAEFDDPSSLTQNEARAQVEALRDAIEYHDYRYYVQDDPVIADHAYDRLFDRLQTLEEEFDLSDPNSPTRRVGGEPLDELESVEHVRPMLSLDSGNEVEEVRSFDEQVRDTVDDVTYSVEPKLDGFSIELVYEDGALERAVTRGDGEVGEDVTANVRTVHSVPLHLGGEPPAFLAVRGEIYMPRSGFQTLNERRIQRGDEPFKNPRNAAAGTVRQLDPSVVADRPLAAFVFDVLETSATIDSQRAAFDLMESVGLPCIESQRFVESIEEVIAYRNEMLDKRETLEYEIDGVVAKVDDFDARDDLGSTARHPRWAFAYKFPPRQDATVVQSITVQVGRTGKLTPVALVEPVDVGGVTISRASLHNLAQVRELGVSSGARVRIERAGEVIPQIVAVESPGTGEWTMPIACPVCGGAVAQEGEHHFCTNATACPAQLKRSLEHFCSKSAMDIEGVGEEVAEEFVETGLVESIADLYALDESDLAALPGWGRTSASNLVAELEDSKDCELWRFIHALGIRHVGAERARRLAAVFDLEELRGADAETLQSVEDIGPEVAESIASFFENEANQTIVDELLAAGVSPERVNRETTLEGFTIVITGSVPGFTRDDLTELLERHGASVTSSVSGATDYLIVGENPGTRKREQAAAEDVTQLDVQEFRERILEQLPEIEVPDSANAWSF